MKLKLERVADWYDFELTNERNNKIEMNATPAIGGKDTAFRPMEALAGSLAACSSIDVLNILKKQKLRPKYFSVDVNAKRKTNEIPSIFESITLIFNVSSDVSKEKITRAIDLSINKYCSVSKILEPTCEVKYNLVIV